MSLKINLLGAPYIEKDGEAISVDTRKAIAILAYVLVTNTRQSRETLAALLWEESDTKSAKAALRRTLSTLNKAIDSPDLIIERSAVTFVADDSTVVDVLEFEALLEQVNAHDHEDDVLCVDCIARLETACALYTSHFMQGFGLRDSVAFDTWQITQSEYYQRRLIWALSQLLDALIHQHEYDTAIEYATLWLEIDPLHEATHRMLMRLFVWKRDRSSALQQYRTCVRILDQELGVTPLEETTALYHELQSTSLAYQSPSQPQSLPSQIQRNLRTLAIFVGRQNELTKLGVTYDESRYQQQICVIEGEQGIGKTRLLEEFTQHFRDSTAYVLVKCFANESGLAYSLIVNLLRRLLVLDDNKIQQTVTKMSSLHRIEVARLIPELMQDINDTNGLDMRNNDISRIRLFEAVTEFLSQCVQALSIQAIIIDDIHWSDDASAHLLAYILQRLKDLPIMIIIARTTGLMSVKSPIQSLLMQQQRAGTATIMLLERLTRDAVKNWVSQTTATAIDERLYAETEGLPLFIHEYLSLLQERSSGGDQHWELPVNVRDSLRFRLNNLSDLEYQLLTTATVIGQSFSFELLQIISGRSEEEIISGIEFLLNKGLITESRVNTLNDTTIEYDFFHNKLRTLLYEDLSFARQRLLHRRVAHHLYDTAQRKTSSAFLGQIAYHFEQAREDNLAAKLYFDAAQKARSLYAHREALNYYEHALALGCNETAMIHYGMGQIYTIQGQYSRAIRHYETAISQATDGLFARIEYHLAQVHHRLGAWDIAEQHYTRAFDSVQDTEQGIAALILADWCLTAIRQNQRIQGQALAQKSLDLALKSHDKRSIAQAHNILGILARDDGNYAEAINHLEDSITIASDIKSVGAQIAALNNLALVHFADDNLEIALELAQSAVILCGQIGAKHQEAALYSHIGDILFRMNRVTESQDYQKRSASILTEIDHVDGVIQPEIWKLVDW